MGPTIAAVSRARPRMFSAPSVMASPSTSSAPSTDVVAENLFKRHVEDLQRSVHEMQGELARATACEHALRSSLDERKTALWRLLHYSATAGLHLPQCGPLRMPVNCDLEREAMRSAVQEQLQWNLRLRSDESGIPSELIPVFHK